MWIKGVNTCEMLNECMHKESPYICDWLTRLVICGPAKEGRKKMKNDMKDEEGRQSSRYTNDMTVARNEVLKITFHSCNDSIGGLKEKNEYTHNPTYL